MKILLTGLVQSYADAKGIAVLESRRKAKDGPQTETFYLKFHSEEAYAEFKGRYACGAGVQVIGLLRQIQTPLLDRVSKAPLVGTSGHELRQTVLSIEVKEHKPHTPDEADTLYAHGIVTLVEKKELKQSASGLPYWRARVVFSHYKRPDESQGQGDFYNVVAFGGQAESLETLEKGDRFAIDYGVVSANPYEVKDLQHGDGSPVVRNAPEMTIREFSYLPKPRPAAYAAVGGLEDRLPAELPF